jgi:AmmeMemoRadiSam system protein B/AmmeMemoRadiSam system protein A
MIRITIAFGLLIAATGAAVASDVTEGPERDPAVAGRFYPSEPDKLEAAVRGFLDDAVAPRHERPGVLVVPHAGYIFSGQIAADGYRQAAGHEYDVVVILGTNHTHPTFSGVSIWPGGAYRTPLGAARIDGDLAAALTSADEEFTFERDVHTREHSVEVQVPFVQVVFPGAKIVTAVIGSPDPDLCRRFGRALAGALGDRRALVVASSDLSHYPTYDAAVQSDRAILEAIAGLDTQQLLRTVRRQLELGRPGLDTCACGLGPILAALEAARAMGLDSARIVSYANSGDTAVGDRSKVVGYGAVAISKGGSVGPAGLQNKAPTKPDSAALQPEDRQALLEFARETIHRYLTTGTAPLARGFSPRTRRLQGAYVTLTRDGALRGCTGFKDAIMPLDQAVGAAALQAAFNDRRFRPVELEELEHIDIEVSALTPLQEVRSPQEIVPGRDGVFMSRESRAAIFLPRVATDQGWDREELLDRLCLKAGLPRGSWREGARLYTFRAEVFREP